MGLLAVGLQLGQVMENAAPIFVLGSLMPHPSNRSAIELFLNRLCSHSRLNEEEQAAILKLPTSFIQFAPHADIVRMGETVDQACLVSEGLIGRMGEREDGSRQFVSVHIPGEMVDLPSLMLPRSTTALHALTASSIQSVPHRSLRELSFRYPAIAAAFWRDCVLDAGIVAQWVINLGSRDARTRLAHFFCELAVRYRLMDQSDGRAFRLPMTQEQLADALGLTPVHINRTLQSLRGDGLISFDQGRVDILDTHMLEAAAEFDPAYLMPSKST